MPTLSIDDFMASRKAPAQAPPATPTGKAGSLSVDDFMKQRAASGHAPDWTDDVKASVKFFGNEVVGVGQALNPVNIAAGLYNTVVHPIDTGRALLNTPGRMIEQYQNGDMDGLAQGIGNIAGTVIGAKVAPEVPGMARTTAQTIGDAIDATAAGVKSVAAHPAVGVAAPLAAKLATQLIPGGKFVRMGMDVWEAAKKAQPKTQPVTTDTTISASQVSPEAASNALGTKPPSLTVTESSGKGARTVDSLDAETAQALVDAHKNGDLKKLSPQTKVELTQAVKAGDNGKVATILDQHTAAKGVFAAVENKVNVLAKYIQDHNIDPGQIATAADRQTLADAAFAHGSKNGLPVPKSGRYRGVSDDTWKLVQEKLSGK